jgi:ABC-type cobalamin/Fe3+-siderophores transport system ATPase subunit
MLKKLHLSQYKAFEKFDITFRPGQNILVGPNNAGKSTIIAALRLCAILMRNAQRINPNIAISDKGRSILGYPLSNTSLKDLPGYTDENVHHNFRLREEARIELVAVDGATLTVVWPADEDGFYYFDSKTGMNARRRSQVAEHASSIGIVPALTPIDNNEELLTPKYIASALGSRLTSRHFRNHMYHLQKSDPKEFEMTILSVKILLRSVMHQSVCEWHLRGLS